MSDGWMTGDPPCWYSGDHYWPLDGGGVCVRCGARLRCLCGRFIRVDDIDAHIERGECRSVPAEAIA